MDFLDFIGKLVGVISTIYLVCVYMDEFSDTGIYEI